MPVPNALSILELANLAAVEGHPRIPITMLAPSPGFLVSQAGCPYPINKVKYQSHSHAELFEVQVPVIINICQIPYPLKLVVPQLTVFQHRRRLGASEMCTTIREGCEDFPVFLDFALLDALVRHVGGGKPGRLGLLGCPLWKCSVVWIRIELGI